MSNNISHIKPWFVDDISNTLSSVYFSLGIHGRKNPDYWQGVLATLSALMLMFGINPQAILTAEDVQRLRGKQ